MVVRIVADDLTGALDTAAPFAAASGPLPIFWNKETTEEGSYALDTETREQPTDSYRWLVHLQAADLAFKKIDSLLRGRTAEEIIACLGSGHFRSAIIAPAFPAQGRITRGARQYWQSPDHGWLPVATDLIGALQARLPVRHAGSAAALASPGYYLCDASTEGDLAAIVSAGRRMAGPALWCGSAGLARALAGPSSRQLFAPARPLLILIGSHHSVSRAQHDAIEAHAPDMITTLRSSEAAAIETAVAGTADAIGRGVSSVLAMALPTTSVDAAREVLAATFGLVAMLVPRPGSLFVTGGETLHGLLQALGARSLLATGELMPGVPVSRTVGGRWHDLTVISKSGGFGAPDLLIRLAESVMP